MQTGSVLFITSSKRPFHFGCYLYLKPHRACVFSKNRLWSEVATRWCLYLVSHRAIVIIFPHMWRHYLVDISLRNIVVSGPPTTCTFTRYVFMKLLTYETTAKKWTKPAETLATKRSTWHLRPFIDVSTLTRRPLKKPTRRHKQCIRKYRVTRRSADFLHRSSVRLRNRTRKVELVNYRVTDNSDRTDSNPWSTQQTEQKVALHNKPVTPHYTMSWHNIF